MFGALQKILEVLTPPERRQLWLLLPAVIGMAILETAGVGSIIPFLALLGDPSVIDRQPTLKWAYEALAFGSKENFFFAFGLGVLAFVTFGNAYSALTTWALLRFSWMRNHTLATRLLEAYLRRPYVYFLTQNTAELGKNILTEVQSCVAGVIVQALNLAARVVVASVLLGTLLWLDPILALGVGGCFGGVYAAIFVAVRRQMVQDGVARVAANEARFKIAAEALGGVKEVQLYGLEPAVVAAFDKPSLVFARVMARNAVISALPRFGLESIAIGGVLVLVLLMLSRGEALTTALPVLGLYAFAAYRLMPSLQAVFGGLTQMRFNLGSLEITANELAAMPPEKLPVGGPPLPFTSTLELRDVAFAYGEREALAGISLALRAGQWAALVGSTGSGKSTLVDLVLGVLEPSRGQILIDGVVLSGTNRRAWQKNVAYVPQMIFMVDDSIERNICFGLPNEAVDRDRMVWAAKVAQIHDFIVADLPDGYGTVIGERGVRLSGGQRQRLGVARALYRRPKLLVLDEATSALDGPTEQRFFEALRRELVDATVLSIAHRLSTTRSFDLIHVVERGRIVDVGSFDALATRQPLFRVQVGGGDAAPAAQAPRA